MRRRGFVQATLFLTVAFAATARAEDPPRSDELVPVPADWLEGTRLVLERGECTIDAPGADWHWLCPRAALTTGFLEVRCQGPTPAERFFLQVEPERLGKLTPDKAEDFLGKLDGAYAQKVGLKIEKIGCEPSDVPIPGRSFRFTNTLRNAKGEATYSHGYIASARQIYVLGAMSTSEDEPRGLATSAASFHTATYGSSASPVPGASAAPGASPTVPRIPAPPPLGIGTILLVLSIPLLVLLAGVIAVVIAWRRRDKSGLEGGAAEKGVTGDERSPQSG